MSPLKDTQFFLDMFLKYIYLFILRAGPTAHGSSWARDQTRATAATPATAVAMAGSLTCWVTRELQERPLNSWCFCRGTVETNPTRNHKVAGSIPGLAQWVKDLVLLWAVAARVLCCRGCDVGRWLQLQIRPLAWEPPYATGVALKKQKDKKKSVLSLKNTMWKYVSNFLSTS